MLSTLLYDIVRKLYRSILRRTGEAVCTRTMLHAVYWSIFSCLTPWFTIAAQTPERTILSPQKSEKRITKRRM